MRIAINGFGRIGRAFLRTLLADKATHKKIDVAVINIGPGQIDVIAHLFKYDTIMGTYSGNVRMDGGKLHIDDKIIAVVAKCNPEDIGWQNYQVDWVVDASGHFTKRENAERHIKSGAQHVLITAPATDEDISIIPCINQELFDSKKHQIVSLGSCTTNAFIPMLKVINDNFGILNGFMTTIHAYTNSQVLLDVEAKSLRLSRAAALNIIPTTTGASKMITKILPELGSCIAASSLRVPVGIVSLIDLTVNVKKKTSTQDINAAFLKASQTNLSTLIGFTNEPLVSSDFKGDPHSVIIDGLSTDVQDSMVKVMGWYDNEWGYSERLKDFLLFVS